MIELLIGFLLGGALVLLSVLAGARISGGGAGAERERTGQKPQQEEKPDEEEAARSREIAEGIQNLLTYGKDLEERL